MRTQFDRANSERGAVLVHVAVILIGVMALSTFVADQGIMWTSRRQSQNVADGAALAGAISLAFDSPDISNTGQAYLAAKKVVEAGRVWGQTPGYVITIGPSVCPPEWPGVCVRADIYRDGTNGGGVLPMIFGHFVGRTQQGVKATATAQVLVANATDCLKPWGVIDKWNERWVPPAPWDQTKFFDKYIQSGPDAGDIDTSITDPDNYIPPTTSDVGTGFHPYNPDRSYTNDYGRQLRIQVGDHTDFGYASGWFAPLALNDSKGGNDFGSNIKNCVGTVYQIGQEIELETEPGKKVGPTRQSVETDADSLVNKDPDAWWDPTANGGAGAVVDSDFPVSPRIVAVPLVDPDQMTEAQKGGRTSVAIRNIMGFFIEGYDEPSKSVIGRLCTLPGMKLGSAAPIGGESAFMQAIVLVR